MGKRIKILLTVLAFLCSAACAFGDMSNGYISNGYLIGGMWQYGSELNTVDNAVRPGNDTNSIAGWVSFSVDIFESQSVEVQDDTYAYHANSNTTPHALARFYESLPAYCTEGHTYRLTVWARHVGTGDSWYILVSRGNNHDQYGGGRYTIANTDTDWKIYTFDFTFTQTGDDAGRTDYFICWTAGTSGGLYLDNFSIKEVQ